MFEYFPNEPNWNFSIALALLGGGNLHEIDGAIRPLKNGCPALLPESAPVRSSR